MFPFFHRASVVQIERSNESEIPNKGLELSSLFDLDFSSPALFLRDREAAQAKSASKQQV
jgi:hypothetical protein